MQHKNPYGAAAGAYASTADATDQRSLEARVLLKSALQLEELAKVIAAGEKIAFRDISDILEHNQKIWQLFVNETMNPDHPLPQAIKNNIASLGVFVFKRTQELMIDAQAARFSILIDINRNIASGLMKAAASSLPVGAAAPPPAGKTETTV